MLHFASVYTPCCQPVIRPNFSSSHTFSLTSSFTKAKWKQSLISGYPVACYCVLLGVVAWGLKPQKLTLPNSNSIWNTQTRLNEFIWTPMCFVGKQAIYNLQFFFTGQTFESTTPNISFVPWLPKRSSTMLDPFAQLFQHCWGHVRSLRMVTKTYGLYPSHDALQVSTLLGVVPPVCTPLPTRTQQLPTFLGQQCWGLLRPFACRLKPLSVHRLILQFCSNGHKLSNILHTSTTGMSLGVWFW